VLVASKCWDILHPQVRGSQGEESERALQKAQRGPVSQLSHDREGTDGSFYMKHSAAVRPVTLVLRTKFSVTIATKCQLLTPLF
jgi:hypothetical protein